MGIKISLIIASLFLCRMFYLRYEKQPMKHPPLKTADRALANINQHQNINLINKITVIWEILWYVPCQTHITVIVYLHIWRKTLGESLEHTAQFVAYWPRTTSLIVNIIHHPKTVHMRICIYIWLSWQNCALEFLCFAPVTFSDSVTSQLCCKAKSLVGYGWVPWITHHEPNRYLHSSLTQTHTDTHKHFPNRDGGPLPWKHEKSFCTSPEVNCFSFLSLFYMSLLFFRSEYFLVVLALLWI